jgi:hypothetical protein
MTNRVPIVVRTTGCGRFTGIVLIGSGLLILFLNTGFGIPAKYFRFWPVVIIAFGMYLISRHYWELLMSQSRMQQVIEAGAIPRFAPRGRSLSPPGFPSIVTLFGVWLLLRNLHVITVWVTWVVLLVSLGVLIIAGSMRGSFARH